MSDTFRARVLAGDIDGAFEEAWALGYQEASVDLLHPEFGTAWGPDGECTKAYQLGVSEAARVAAKSLIETHDLPRVSRFIFDDVMRLIKPMTTLREWHDATRPKKSLSTEAPG